MTTICWHEPGPWHRRCRKDHNDHISILYGRCRSGRRWFWNAVACKDEWPSEHGWVDSEAQALEAARDAVARLAAGRPAVANPVQQIASRKLKEINTEKRRARPPSKAKDSARVAYLYSRSWVGGGLYRFRITKRTAKRIYYLRKDEPIDEHGEPKHYNGVTYVSSFEDQIGFIDRQRLEADGVAHNHGRHWSASDYHLYASLEGLLAARGRKPEERIDLATLKAAMAAAHPDKGGSDAAFIEARQRYVAARRAQRHA